MAKPRIQSRVDPHVKSRVDEFAEAEGMAESEAVRYLVQTGLDREEKTLSDGGEPAAREQVDNMRRELRRQEALTVAGVAYLALYVSGFLSDVMALAAGVVLLAAFGYWYWRGP